ncbi:PIN domain-containing protein [Candidatus Accumulibacter phosphatis]|uniref:PIN domain-containing protein n=1 Tax=Candidatus Accumulibacter phosphatis TaxID=327160 RepID=UPI003C6C0670
MITAWRSTPSAQRSWHQYWTRFFSTIATLPFDEADAQAAAAICAALKTQGQPIGAYDVLIAGTGMARGLVVVTSNVGEFKRVSGLQVEDWR